MKKILMSLIIDFYLEQFLFDYLNSSEGKKKFKAWKKEQKEKPDKE